jgi:hypothetical protein
MKIEGIEFTEQPFKVYYSPPCCMYLSDQPYVEPFIPQFLRDIGVDKIARLFTPTVVSGIMSISMTEKSEICKMTAEQRYIVMCHVCHLIDSLNGIESRSDFNSVYLIGQKIYREMCLLAYHEIEPGVFRNG